MKYSDLLADWLVELGYTHCFFVGGGNIMHLLESLNQRLKCHAVVNEVAAGIAAEYFNETGGGRKALALVTAGPGLTNIVTSMAGAFLESRELLVLGGQVKTSDLAHGQLRQRGIQEIDGVTIARPITKLSVLLKQPASHEEFLKLLSPSWTERKGPVFIEIPLDVQAQVTNLPIAQPLVSPPKLSYVSNDDCKTIAKAIREAQRPLFLLGGGIERNTSARLRKRLNETGVPTATTWNGLDRIDATDPVFVGRPNTWGQRSANLLLQQADLLIALGTRLGMQQTGFNWQQFVPLGKIIQVDIDEAELRKGHPHVDLAICADANNLLERLLSEPLGDHLSWLQYAQKVRSILPLIEPLNKTGSDYLSPFAFADQLSTICTANDIIIPCSSGGAFTVMMQAFRQKHGQLVVTNKGLASMGYGLSGAIGAAFAHPEKRVVLVEGDGGFSQNLQEVGTVAINNLNLKIFIFDDSGYASIRMTQRSYFEGRYVGCDQNTGLGLPNWEKLFAAWNVPSLRIRSDLDDNNNFIELFNTPGPVAFIVSIDPEQTYFPKITSQITTTGTMVSNPLHKMTPELNPALLAQVCQFLPTE